MSNIASAIGGAFNANEHDTTDTTTPIPPGDYPFLIEKAELRDTKDGSGKYVWIQATVTGEQYAGRKVFENFNIVNSSAEAVRIGRSDLAKLAVAVGAPMLQDTGELVNKAFIGRVKVKDGDNKFSAYKPIGGSAPAPSTPPVAQYTAPAQAQQHAPATAAAAAPVAKKMPWQR
ncbi:MAG TPA: DUF669 domain-containing protein [Chthoniobacteraceae bacterium]|nr:DUF669 domain-containing protein [Chthoniobacteraceae bacterium]